MVDNLKASEISEVLLKQLHDINIDAKYDEVGQVLQVHDGVVRLFRRRSEQCLGNAFFLAVIHAEDAQDLRQEFHPFVADDQGEELLHRL